MTNSKWDILKWAVFIFFSYSNEQASYSFPIIFFFICTKQHRFVGQEIRFWVQSLPLATSVILEKLNQAV